MYRRGKQRTTTVEISIHHSRVSVKDKFLSCAVISGLAPKFPIRFITHSVAHLGDANYSLSSDPGNLFCPQLVSGEWAKCCLTRITTPPTRSIIITCKMFLCIHTLNHCIIVPPRVILHAPRADYFPPMNDIILSFRFRK